MSGRVCLVRQVTRRLRGPEQRDCPDQVFVHQVHGLVHEPVTGLGAPTPGSSTHSTAPASSSSSPTQAAAQKPHLLRRAGLPSHSCDLRNLPAAGERDPRGLDMAPPYIYRHFDDGVTGTSPRFPSRPPLRFSPYLWFSALWTNCRRLCRALVSAGEKALMKAAKDGNLVRLKGTPFSFSSSPPHPWPIFSSNSELSRSQYTTSTVCVCACAVFARSDVCSLTQAALPRVPSVTARLRRCLQEEKVLFFCPVLHFFSGSMERYLSFRDAN
jgi:hypothetical protein